MKFIDLFAGIGGMRRGLELAGHECVGFCEYDKFATASYTSMHLITDEQRAYLATLPLKDRQKEILKEDYRNGEWYERDIRDIDPSRLPRADIWCFGAPCQDFSVASRQRKGLEGDRSSLVRCVFDLIRQTDQSDRPQWLIYENVKGMLSSNEGRDYLSILMEMDELGYDIEWENLNSKYFGVPQNRERIYTVGHLRRNGRSKVFPVERANGEDCFCGLIGHRNGYHRNTQVFDRGGITEALSTCQGGGREHHTIEIIGSLDQKNDTPEVWSSAYKGIEGKVRVYEDIAPTLSSRDYKDPKNVTVSIKDVEVIGNQPTGGQRARVLSEDGISPTLTGSEYKQPLKVGTSLSPDKGVNKQNGKRTREDGEPSYTLTAKDIQGIAIKVEGVNTMNDGTCRTLKNQYQKNSVTNFMSSSTIGATAAVIQMGIKPESDEKKPLQVTLQNGITVYAVWYPKKQCYIAIRKLTPKECYRLQGWTDDYFDKAQFVNSDSQLYKQAGNGVTVNVVEAIGKKLKEIEDEDLGTGTE